MKLIIILLCLWLDHYLHVGARGRQQEYFEKYENFLKANFERLKVPEGMVSLIVIAAPVIVLVGFFQMYGAMYSNLAELILGVLVLLFCLGASPLQAKIEHYLKPAEDQGSSAESDLKSFMSKAGVGGKGSFYRQVTELQLWQSHERFFAVVFWFLILGPIGAILYRMISWFHDDAMHGEACYASQEEHMGWLHSWAAWIPARLVALSYTLVGNFMNSFDLWYKEAIKKGHVKEILVDCGMASLGLDDVADSKADKQENELAQSLIHRALLVWVLIIAVATISKLFL